MTTNSNLATTAAEVASRLADFDHLPAVQGLYFYPDDHVCLSLDELYRTAAGFRAVALWAQEFDALVKISLPRGGSGEVFAFIQLGGHAVKAFTNIGTAQAYQLGAALGESIDEDTTVTVTAEELLAALAGDTAEAVATNV